MSDDMNLDMFRDRIAMLRINALADLDTDPFCLDAESYYQLALAALEQARIFADMARNAETRAIAERQTT